MEKYYHSRFFVASDYRNSDFIVEIPKVWWSRSYEYGWASQFVSPEDTTLDAACGLEHPLKFFLLDHCKESYACDHDERILNHSEIERAFLQAFGSEALEGFPKRYLQDVQFKQASLNKLPYPAKHFDKIYCISVLEHLSDWFNKYVWLLPLNKVLPFAPRMIEHSLFEFRRVLKDDGLIVLTFDYPRINLAYFKWLIENLGFEFAGPVHFSLPSDALYSKSHKLHCFRAVIRKKRAIG